MSQNIALRLRKASLWTKIVVLGGISVLPAAMPATVHAAPSITSRTLTSTSAQPSTTTQLSWSFNTTAAAGNVNTIEIEFCDSPLGTCATTNVPAIAASPTATLTNFTTNGVTSTTRASGDSGGTDNQIEIVKSTADTGTSLSGATITLAASDITNIATPNASYYTRVRIYSDNPGTTPNLKWEGVFAQSTSRTLTVNARVQERLDFCVGSTAVDNATVSPGADCSAITGSSVDIGNIESGNTNVSPVTATNGGSNENGIAMVRTNAVGGASVAYHALGDTSSGTLKIPGQTCVASPVSNTGTDQCFNSSSTQGAFTAGVENFGMTVAGVNCVSTTAYTCSYAADSYNLRRAAAYDGTGSATTYVADANQVPGTTAAGYAWDADPANTTQIATSVGAPSGIYVIDDEALILKFAATSGITTPTGSYTVQADFIATTTF